MKKWFEKINDKTKQWMQGRYGSDEFNRCLSIVSLVLLFLSLLSPLKVLYFPAILLILWSCIRCCSKDHEKRRKERETYIRITGNIRSWSHLQTEKWRDRKDYRYFLCKNCKASLRVPKGKGNIRIRCPKCHSESDART